MEYTLPTGEYGRAVGAVINHSEQTGTAEIKVDPADVALEPLPLGDSDSVADGEPIVALAVQDFMSLQHATGSVTGIEQLKDTFTGNEHAYLFVDDLHFPSDVQSQPLAELGGPVFDETGHVVAVVGPPGDMSGAWHYSPDGTSKTWDRPTAAPQQAIGAWWVIRDIKFVGAADWGTGFPSGKPYLGVEYQWLSPEAARGLGEPAGGALIEEVYVGSPAAAAGIRGKQSIKVFDGDTYWVGGDVIVSVDEVQLTEDDSIQAIAERHKVDDVIPVQLWRGDQLMTIQVMLTAAP